MEPKAPRTLSYDGETYDATTVVRAVPGGETRRFATTAEFETTFTGGPQQSKSPNVKKPE